MGAVVKIDEIDEKILRLLIKDARTRLKDIAKDCNISSVSVLNRIKRLKTLGVITGAALFPRVALINLPTIANIGINLDSNESNEDEIIKLIGEQINLVEPSASVGKYDLCALVFTENVSELDKAVYAVRKGVGVRKIDVNIYSGEPHFVFENINLQPKGI
jgi:Lrp/AsnC family transcriptional regulator for asnA, asnC and gidA